MRKYSLTLLILAICSFCFSQTGSIKGTVIDTTENRNLSNSVVSIIRKSDSVLVGFSRTDVKGDFKIDKVRKGDYILLVTYPKFADYVDIFKVGDTPDVRVGRIILTPKSQLLKEVVIRQKMGAIRMKGDTLSFMADSFAVREGATVEDLLKKLPGLQVNKDGEITAQGEKVQKVLVDGEEFFSDDPAVVTQNLRADAVKEVQVFDKKSDQAAFTGIDDGEKTKTINLKLKDDKKRGMFGKVSVGGGLPGSFAGEGMVNAFKGKRKIAGFGIMSNTGRVGLNWQDSDKYGGGNNFEYNEEEGYFFSFSQGDDEFGDNWGGTFGGQGLPTAWTGGTHFSNKWLGDKFHVNGNYRFNKQNLFGKSSTITQYLLPGKEYINYQDQDIYKQNQRHSLNGFYEIKLDSLSTLKISVNGSTTNSRNNSRFNSEAFNLSGDPLNTSNRHLASVSNRQQFISSAIWRKKFKKKGRTISWSIDQNYNNIESDGIVQSLNEFYTVGNLDSTSVIDQQKLNRSKTSVISTRIAYTEPLSKTAFIEMNYSYRVNNSEALRSSFDKSTNGKYENLNPLFSNDYDFRINTNSGGLNFRVNKSQYNYSFGGNISRADFRQQDLVKDTLSSYSFTNFFPRANFRYNFGPQKRLGLNYNGNTRQPSLEQLQPIRENTDPLNIQIGNPDLKQEFRHSISMNYNDYKILTSRNMYFSVYYAFIDNAISSDVTVDNSGKRVTRFINVDGNFLLNGYMGYWKQIKKWNLNLGINGNVNISHNTNFVNNLENINNNRSGSVGLNINHDKEKKYSFSLNPRFGYTTSRSSISTVKTQYWTSDNEIDATIELPWKLQFNTNAEISLREKTAVFGDNNNVTKWNAWLAKKFWKSNSGEIRFSIFDILDQNIGLRRTANSNFITENRYDTFRRYWLLTFTWNFTKNPAVATPGTAK
jgi:hypothetical protein